MLRLVTLMLHLELVRLVLTVLGLTSISSASKSRTGLHTVAIGTHGDTEAQSGLRPGTGSSTSTATPITNYHRVQDFLHRMYEDVTNSSQSTVLQLACALFVQNGTKLSPAFAQYVSSSVNSSLQQANFSEPNRTRTQISQWVHSQSGGEITDVMSCDLIGSTLTQIAMVNTVFFKSTWQKQFLFTDSEPALHHRRRIHLKSTKQLKSTSVNYLELNSTLY
ncbi:Serpin E3 [Acipenser ruthenus]|uniref:Serpin E3 n=1 Tax=Acipenser ruthenus TaxID=7906 RepID=A0A444U9U1_ACIRT|nr:Serpin E3 [Acipenser ruthenus]